jgi:hypothetical protein
MRGTTPLKRQLTPHRHKTEGTFGAFKSSRYFMVHIGYSFLYLGEYAWIPVDFCEDDEMSGGERDARVGRRDA